MNQGMNGEKTMQKYLSAIVMLVVLCGLAVTARAMIGVKEDLPGLPSMAPEGNQVLRASVVSKNPAHYTLDIRKFANIGVNQDAPTYAIYTGNSLPVKCADLRGEDVSYWKPSKYKRTFDLRGHEDVIKGIEGYGCVVIRNLPTAG